MDADLRGLARLLGEPGLARLDRAERGQHFAGHRIILGNLRGGNRGADILGRALAGQHTGNDLLTLLDAPCSGLGTLQRHPEIKLRMNEARINLLAALQMKMIENAARSLRAGGLLVYSVCSTEPEEGEEVIAWFRGRHPEFRDLTRERLVELGLDPAPLLTSSFGARTFTHRTGSESFFFCALWKRR